MAKTILERIVDVESTLVRVVEWFERQPSATKDERQTFIRSEARAALNTLEQVRKELG